MVRLTKTSWNTLSLSLLFPGIFKTPIHFRKYNINTIYQIEKLKLLPVEMFFFFFFYDIKQGRQSAGRGPNSVLKGIPFGRLICFKMYMDVRKF